MEPKSRTLTAIVSTLICCTGVTAAVVVPGPPISSPQSHVVHDVRLLADALIMTGTNMPVVDQAWMQMAVHNYISPTMGGGYTAIPVTTPEEFRPFTGLHDLTFDASVREGTSVVDAALAAALQRSGDSNSPTVVFGYSQSSVIATMEKRQLAERTANESSAPAVSFVLTANPNRPNGGLNARFAGLELKRLGWTFSGATPTDTPFTTVDVARQYDLFADFPVYPADLFATANAVVALFYGAHDYTSVTINPDDPAYDPNTVVQQQGDTTYYFIPASQLPLLRPLRDAGVDPVLVDAAEPAVRVLVEAGYERSTPFGQPTPAQTGAVRDPAQIRSDFKAAVKQGSDILKAAKADAAVASPSAKESATVADRHQDPTAARPPVAAATRSRR